MRWRIPAVVGVVVAGVLAAGALTGRVDRQPPVADRAGVTTGPCPAATGPARGCVYLGVIADLGRPEVAASVEAQQRFWARVNRAGGIGGYDIDVTTHVRDARDTAAHMRAYREIRGRTLALAVTGGSGGTAAILPELRRDRTVAVPESSSSGWGHEPLIMESGASHCVQAVNAVDYARSVGVVRSVMSVHLTGDYGDDVAGGVKSAAATAGLTFIGIKADPGAERQDGSVFQVVARQPDLVVLAMPPAETEVIVREAVARGYRGRFVGAAPSWDPSMSGTPVLRERYLRSSPWLPWSTDTPGHRAMRDALSGVSPHEGQVAGWVRSYPLKAALTAAAARGRPGRASLAAAARDLRAVDYEGMLPDGYGRVTQSVITDPAAGTGVADEPVARPPFEGPSTAKAPTEPCFRTV